jgi:antibiotic biosynthesis monooxygenase (ABM) superfamily enzyme
MELGKVERVTKDGKCMHIMENYRNVHIGHHGCQILWRSPQSNRASQAVHYTLLPWNGIFILVVHMTLVLCPKLHCLSLRVYYTDRAAPVCRRN